MHGDKEETGFMRLFSGLLISTLAVGTIVTTGCAEHRYQDPYYGSGGYYGYNDPYYREWLAERRYDNIEYNRLSRERQREYWEWRRQNEARFRNDPRFRDNDSRFRDRVVRNDHDADDRRRNDHDADDRGRTYARARNEDRDRHRDDRNRHDVRKNRDKDHDRHKDHDKDRDHDRDHDRR
jgi:translation initiation factor 3 subunit A